MSENVHPGPMWHCDNIFTPDVTVYSLFTRDGGVLEIIEWSVLGRGWRGNDRHRPPLQLWPSHRHNGHNLWPNITKNSEGDQKNVILARYYSYFLPFNTIFLLKQEGAYSFIFIHMFSVLLCCWCIFWHPTYICFHSLYTEWARPPLPRPVRAKTQDWNSWAKKVTEN